MGLLIGLAVGFVVVLLVLWRVARHVKQIEDDSSIMIEESGFTPYGQRVLDFLRGRR